MQNEKGLEINVLWLLNHRFSTVQQVLQLLRPLTQKHLSLGVLTCVLIATIKQKHGRYCQHYNCQISLLHNCPQKCMTWCLLWAPLLQKLGQFESVLSIENEKQSQPLKRWTLCQQICRFCSTDTQQLTIQEKQIPGCHSGSHPTTSVKDIQWCRRDGGLPKQRMDVTDPAMIDCTCLQIR